MKNELKGKAQITCDASLALHFPSEKEAKAAYDALLAEADFSHRGGSAVRLEGAAVRVEITAEDPVSLRASLTSYLRLTQVIKSVEENSNGEG